MVYLTLSSLSKIKPFERSPLMEQYITNAVTNELQSAVLVNRVKHFFKSFSLAALAYKSNIRKEAGFNAMNTFYQIFLTPFFNEGITGLWKDGFVPPALKDSAKDTYYRFLSNPRFHWRKFLTHLAVKAINRFSRLSNCQDRVLILDDSTLPKRGKHIELVSWVFDHVLKKSTLGFKNLVLGWSDGWTFIPFDFSLAASSNQPNNVMKPLDKRTIGAKRRKDALRSKLDIALEMLKKADSLGIDASFVLFDSWFSFPSFINKVYQTGYNVICRLKPMPNIRYLYKNKEYDLNTLYRKFIINTLTTIINPIPGKSSSLIVATKEGLQVKIVFYRENKGSSWSAFLSTDCDMDSEKILMTYSKRWAIEPFFKETKQHLRLGKEQNRDFDSIFASSAIAFVRYLFLSVTKRLESDPRTLGELFQTIQVEVKELSVPQIFIELLSDKIKKMSSTLNLADSIYTQFMKIVDSIRCYLSAMIKFDALEGCET